MSYMKHFHTPDEPPRTPVLFTPEQQDELNYLYARWRAAFADYQAALARHETARHARAAAESQACFDRGTTPF